MVYDFFMHQQITYGSGREITLDWQDAAARVVNIVPSGEPLSDPEAAMRAALRQPTDFPPLDAAIVPGDRIVVVVEPGLPSQDALILGVIRELIAGGAEPANITVLTVQRGAEEPQDAEERQVDAPTETTADVPSPDSPQASIWLALGVTHVQHRREDAASLAYLAATDDADPIYLNRALLDADFVIPIGLQRLDDSLGYLGLAGGVYPTFGDLAAVARLCPTDAAFWDKHRKKLRQESFSVLWQLGIQLVIQVTPGLGEQVLDVVAGQLDAVAREGRLRCERAWRSELRAPASLVVVGVQGRESEETWDELARALAMAERVATDDAAIVVCVDASRRPRPAPRPIVAEAAKPTKRGRNRIREFPTLSASLVERLGESHRLYLVADLDSEVCEELGFVRVESADDLSRLTRGHAQCLIVAGGQYAGFRVGGEEAS